MAATQGRQLLCVALAGTDQERLQGLTNLLITGDQINQQNTVVEGTESKRQSRKKRGARGKRRAAKAQDAPEPQLSQYAEVPNMLRQASSQLGTGASTWMSSAATSGELGWDRFRPGRAIAFSEDSLTCWKTESGEYGGALGSALFAPGSGTHCFAVRVSEPVDDSFWVGVAYADVYADDDPKRNGKAVVWSGGNVASGRPGTVRVHGEKFRKQAQFRHGDVVGVVVDCDRGDLLFYLNGVRSSEWRGVLRPLPLHPYAAMRHSGGPAATLLQWAASPPPPAAVGSVSADAAAAAAGGGSGGGRLVQDSVSDANRLPDVDGSLLEGGGQVLRVALAFGALLGRPLHIHSIRAGRSRPGLGHQHSTGAKLVGDLCGASMWPDTIQHGAHLPGATSLRMWPGVRGLAGGSFMADTHTAGAVSLLLQAALPCAVLTPRRGDGDGDGGVTMTLRGGTNTSFAPSVDFQQLVLAPLLCRFGVPRGAISFDIRRRGYYPEGGGEVAVAVRPVRGLRALDMCERGRAVRVEAVVFGGGTGRRSASGVASSLRTLLRDFFAHDGEGGAAGAEVEVEVSIAANERTPSTAAALADGGGGRGRGSGGGGGGAQAQARQRWEQQKARQQRKQARARATSTRKKKKEAAAGDAAAAATAAAATAAAGPRHRRHPPPRAGLTFKERAALSAEQRARVTGACGCQIVVTTSTGCLLAADSLQETNPRKGRGDGLIHSREVAAAAMARLSELWAAGGCCCEYTADQLLVFMALAHGRSRLLIPGPTSISSLHLRTAIHFATLLTGVRFTVTDVPHQHHPDTTAAAGADTAVTGDAARLVVPPCRLVECEGMGFGSLP